jgi:hypothetical protein
MTMWRTLAIALTAALPAAAQRIPISHELRVDGIAARRSAVEAGGSIIVPFGVYARTGFTAAGGLADRDSGSKAVGRVEILSRFLLDPFRESPYGLSIGAGVGATNLTAASRWTPYLVAAVDLELSQVSGWIPAVQVGLGNGTRLGISLRSASGRWR